MDIKKAEISGLLHDVTKNTPKQEQLKIINEFSNFDTALTNVQKTSAKLWHSISGALYVEHVLKISDQEIINAIKYHTTARAKMSPLDKVVFVADCTSRDRTYFRAEKIRKLANESLDIAILEILSFTIWNLSKKKSLIDENTFLAYNEFCIKNIV